MYKVLDSDLLEITGRQSDVIELALTYGFKGINVDIVDLYKRCQRMSFESASRFLVSSKLIVASFQVPLALDDDEDTYSARFDQFKALADLAARCKARCGQLNIPNATDRLPYHQYFDLMRGRIDQIAELLAGKGIRLGLRLQAIPDPVDKQFKFIRDVNGLSALIRACRSKNAGLVLDTWNWHLGGGHPDQLDELGCDRIVLVHLADCKEGVDAAAATAEDRLLPGSTGVINNTKWLEKLVGRDLGVAGYGASPNGTVTRETYICEVQDALNETLSSAGIAVSVRKPEQYLTEAESYSSADFKQ